MSLWLWCHEAWYWGLKHVLHSGWLGVTLLGTVIRKLMVYTYYELPCPLPSHSSCFWLPGHLLLVPWLWWDPAPSDHGTRCQLPLHPRATMGIQESWLWDWLGDASGTGGTQRSREVYTVETDRWRGRTASSGRGCSLSLEMVVLVCQWWFSCMYYLTQFSDELAIYWDYSTPYQL